MMNIFRYQVSLQVSLEYCIAGFLLLAGSGLTRAGEWNQWAGGKVKNMVSEETNLPREIEPGKRVKGSEEVDMSTTKEVLWVAKLGSQAYGTPIISQGKVLVGTNNESPRDTKYEGDRGVVMCFNEADGKFLWQLVVPKLGAGKVSDWEYLGICSSPVVDGNRVYVITNRCEVVCLDLEGLANGNDGIYQDESKYVAGPGKDPVNLGATDADIVWVYDMRSELGVFPHNIASSSVLVLDEHIVVTTSNGVDWSHTNIPAPQAPSLITLNKMTGELHGEQDPIVSSRVLHCSWSSPGYANPNGKDIILFGAGDGWAYGLGLNAKEDDEGFMILPELWRYDCNPPEYRKDEDGEPIKYAEYEGPSEVISTPVYYDGLAYFAIGQDPEHGEGVGMVSAIDPTQTGNLSGKAVWTYKGVERSLSTPSVKDGLLYISDYSGYAYCLDAKTGELYWEYDTKGHIWGSTLLADGHVYLGNEEGEMHIMKEGKELVEVGVLEFPAPIFSSPVASNGVLYIATQTHLYACKK